MELKNANIKHLVMGKEDICFCIIAYLKIACHVKGMVMREGDLLLLCYLCAIHLSAIKCLTPTLICKT